MRQTRLLALDNGASASLRDVPVLWWDEFRGRILEASRDGSHLCSLFGQPATGGLLRLYAVLSPASQAVLQVFSTEVGASFPSLTPDWTAAHLFEREIHEQWKVVPRGHPWLKPVRFPQSAASALASGTATAVAPGAANAVASGTATAVACGDTEFFRVEGEEVHEVAVGPVHAGVIEPGHFRFQCHGENVMHLEISLGYQHRGIERRLAGGPDVRGIHLAETLAGDSTVAHATAYCQALEALAGIEVPSRAQAIRGIALELERIANHVGDLGAISGDVAFLPTASFCGRIRGDVLNMTAQLCGNRFGRGLVRPGGTGCDIDAARLRDLVSRMRAAFKDARGACELLWKTPSATARFEGTGALSRETAETIGLVGPAARACGVERDVRRDLPAGIWRFTHVPVSVWDTGDVFARAYVRWLEVQRSFAFLAESLQSLPAGAVRTALPPLRPERIAVSLTEGWRGEVCHTAATDAGGRLAWYKVVDPSFHNWFGLALALRDQPISDFPLCNKSFNLSYCGHDL